MTRKGDFYYFTCPALLLVWVILTVTFISGCSSGEDSTEILISDADSSGGDVQQDNETADIDVYVYVYGEVNEPGVYIVETGTRLYEVIELAGGMTDAAAEGYLNLAAEVYDGERIDVISEDEYSQMALNSDGISQNTDDAAADDGLININTATATELTALPGIGDVKAQAIVAYREANGDFESIEDIMNVDGIKEGSFSKISGLIKVK